MSSAQQLQCPDCSHLHSLGALAGLETFNCANCGRPLKVPAALRAAAGTATVGASASSVKNPAPPPQPTATMPATANAAGPVNPGRQRAMAATTTKPVKVNIWIRLLIWVVAVPIGLAVVFGAARSFGWITSDQLLDTFAAKGWDRFAPIARLLPFAALLIAAMVQASVAFLERRMKATPRGSRSAGPSAASGPDRLETGNVR